MKKQIEITLSEKTVNVFNEDKQRWEKISFEEAGINELALESSDLYETDVVPNAWQPAKGTALQLTTDEVFDVMEIWTLVLG